MLCPRWRRLGSTEPAALDLPLSTATVSPGGPFCCVTRASVTGSLNLRFLPRKVGIPIAHSWDVCVVDTAALSPPAAAANKNPRGVSALLRGGQPWPEPLGRQVGGPLAAAKAGSCLAARTWGREVSSQPDS